LCCAAEPVSSRRALSNALTVTGILLLVATLTIFGDHFLGHGRVGRTLSSAPLPPGLGPVPSSTSGPTPSQEAAPGPVSADVLDKPGRPVRVLVPGHGVRASVSADRLNADGSLYVPPDPRDVSWASEDEGPGSSHGTAILVSHIDYRGVKGAFFDLPEYKVGEIITVVLADGRQMRYAVAAPPIEVHKDQVGTRRQELFDQTGSYGLADRPRSGRLLLLSCGGLFDKRTGHYESNIFVYALPV